MKYVDHSGSHVNVLAPHASRYKLIVITNQSGIGRGYYSESQFHKLTDWMLNEFSAVVVPIEKVYFSPFHPDKGVGRCKKDNISRIPQPSMILKAQVELNLDLGKSILIGDKIIGIQAGIAAAVGINLLLKTEKLAEMSGLKYHSIKSLNKALCFMDKQI